MLNFEKAVHLEGPSGDYVRVILIPTQNDEWTLDVAEFKSGKIRSSWGEDLTTSLDWYGKMNLHVTDKPIPANLQAVINWRAPEAVNYE